MENIMRNPPGTYSVGDIIQYHHEGFPDLLYSGEVHKILIGKTEVNEVSKDQIKSAIFLVKKTDEEKMESIRGTQVIENMGKPGDKVEYEEDETIEYYRMYLGDMVMFWNRAEWEPRIVTGIWKKGQLPTADTSLKYINWHDWDKYVIAVNNTVVDIMYLDQITDEYLKRGDIIEFIENSLLPKEFRRTGIAQILDYKYLDFPDLTVLRIPTSMKNHFVFKLQMDSEQFDAMGHELYPIGEQSYEVMSEITPTLKIGEMIYITVPERPAFEAKVKKITREVEKVKGAPISVVVELKALPWSIVKSDPNVVLIVDDKGEDYYVFGRDAWKLMDPDEIPPEIPQWPRFRDFAGILPQPETLEDIYPDLPRPQQPRSASAESATPTEPTQPTEPTWQAETSRTIGEGLGRSIGDIIREKISRRRYS